MVTTCMRRAIFDGAMTQFVKIIGQTQPIYVILTIIPLAYVHFGSMVIFCAHRAVPRPTADT